MSRPKGSKNRPKVISPEAIEAMAPRRRGRPVGSRSGGQGDRQPGDSPEAPVGRPEGIPQGHRRGRPKGSKNQPRQAVQQATGQWTLDDLAEPVSNIAKEPATDTFCPMSANRQHYGYRGDRVLWCTYCGRISTRLVFPERKSWD